jgi:hypothetical protein
LLGFRACGLSRRQVVELSELGRVERGKVDRRSKHSIDRFDIDADRCPTSHCNGDNPRAAGNAHLKLAGLVSVSTCRTYDLRLAVLLPASAAGAIYYDLRRLAACNPRDRAPKQLVVRRRIRSRVFDEDSHRKRRSRIELRLRRGHRAR